jgi:hypothetical protein
MNMEHWRNDTLSQRSAISINLKFWSGIEPGPPRSKAGDCPTHVTVDQDVYKCQQQQHNIKDEKPSKEQQRTEMKRRLSVKKKLTSYITQFHNVLGNEVCYGTTTTILRCAIPVV